MSNEHDDAPFVELRLVVTDPELVQDLLDCSDDFARTEMGLVAMVVGARILKANVLPPFDHQRPRAMPQQQEVLIVLDRPPAGGTMFIASDGPVDVALSEGLIARQVGPGAIEVSCERSTEERRRDSDSE